MDGLEVRHLLERQVLSLGVGHNGLAQGVLGGVLQAGGDGEQLVFGQLAHRVHTRHLGLALGDGACLVQHDAGHLAQLLQGLGGLDENAVLSPHSGTHHDGHGGGQT